MARARWFRWCMVGALIVGLVGASVAVASREKALVLSMAHLGALATGTRLTGEVRFDCGGGEVRGKLGSNAKMRDTASVRGSLDREGCSELGPNISGSVHGIALDSDGKVTVTEPDRV